MSIGLVVIVNRTKTGWLSSHPVQMDIEPCLVCRGDRFVKHFGAGSGRFEDQENRIDENAQHSRSGDGRQAAWENPWDGDQVEKLRKGILKSFRKRRDEFVFRNEAILLEALDLDAVPQLLPETESVAMSA